MGLFNEMDVAFLSEPWLIKVLVILFVTVALRFIVHYLLNRFITLANSTISYWDDVLAHAAIKPLLLLIWVLGFYFALRVGLQAYGLTEDYDFVKSLKDAAITICIAWFSWRLIDDLSDKYLQSQLDRNEDVDRTTVDALSKLGHLIVVVVSILTLMQTLGFSVSGVLAAGGIGGIAIGFAAKDILANFFGGLTIYTDRPFVVGDWIRSPDKDIEGTVEQISWRYTKIIRFNKNPIYVPNAVFTMIAVENPSRMSNRRIKETIGIRYDDIAKMEAIVRDVKNMLMSHAEIDQDQTLIVNFNAFNASSVDFFIYTFTRTTVWVTYHEIKQDILLKIAEIITKHGAEIAFPTQTLHFANNGQSDGDKLIN